MVSSSTEVSEQPAEVSGPKTGDSGTGEEEEEPEEKPGEKSYLTDEAKATICDMALQGLPENKADAVYGESKRHTIHRLYKAVKEKSLSNSKISG